MMLFQVCFVSGKLMSWKTVVTQVVLQVSSIALFKFDFLLKDEINVVSSANIIQVSFNPIFSGKAFM